MIAINQPHDVAEFNVPAGLLAERMEQDLADALNEFGALPLDGHADQAAEARPSSFGYGIPMAGVRYYSFTGRNED